MHITCNLCGTAVSSDVPAFGTQDMLDGDRAALRRCPNPKCKTTIACEMPDLAITPKGIVAVGKKGPAFGLKRFAIRALVAA